MVINDKPDKIMYSNFIYDFVGEDERIEIVNEEQKEGEKEEIGNEEVSIEVEKEEEVNEEVENKEVQNKKKNNTDLKKNDDLKDDSNEKNENVDKNQLGIKEAPGLSSFYNIGNTCYMNSVLQCLLSCNILKSFFLLEHHKDLIKRNIITKVVITDKKIDNNMQIIKKKYLNNLTKEIGELFIRYWNNNVKIIPSRFKRVLGNLNSNFKGKNQEDSEEFLSYILDKMHDDLSSEVKVELKNDNKRITDLIKFSNKCKEISCNNSVSDENKISINKIFNNYLISNSEDIIDLKGKLYWKNYLEKMKNSIIRDLFTGLFVSKIFCCNCGNLSLSFEPFNILMLPIPDNNYDEIEISECLKNFSKKERLDNSNKYYCKKCKSEVNAFKQIKIWREPQILIIQLKRFSNNNFVRKNNKKIIYPINDLDISNISFKKNKESNLYNLFSITKHYGTLYGGHYKSSSLNPINKHWYEQDDKDIYYIKKENYDTEISSNPASYLLFYEKND